MYINTFSKLKDDETFKLLSQLQAKLEKNDPILNQQAFTASSFQLLSFLIVYAGLDLIKRTQIIIRLRQKPYNLVQLSKDNLDKLINEINWKTILQKDSNSNLQFQFSIELGSITYFKRALKQHAPLLLEGLESSESIIKLSDSADTIKFITEITQTETWTTPFKREPGENYWSVEDFVLSRPLENFIKAMLPGKSTSIGGISITKGMEEDGIELRIAGLESRNKYTSEVKDLEIGAGIYNVFLGMTNFYGLDQVDDVLVQLTNKAEFSDIGAKASQTQTVTYIQESATIPIKSPTVISVSFPLEVYFYGIDIWNRFNSANDSNGSARKNKREDNPNIYIQLNTNQDKQNQTGVFLFSQRVTNYTPELTVSPQYHTALPTKEKFSDLPQKSSFPKKPQSFMNRLINFFKCHQQQKPNQLSYKSHSPQ